jgi:glycine cleavage system H protein
MGSLFNAGLPTISRNIQTLEKRMSYPENYRYTKEHEWIQVEGNVGTVGITDYAQNSLGDIVFVDLPKVGDSIEAGKSFGSVESVKAVSDLFAPVSGKVTAVNDTLKDAPEKINSDANTTWMLKVQLSDPKQVDTLLSAADYEKFTSEETGH